MGGLFAIVLLILIFPLLACIPCCMPSCYDVRPKSLGSPYPGTGVEVQDAAVLVRHQRPIYGYPQQPHATAAAYVQQQAPPHVAYGVPVANY
eukprot:SM000079S22453  [mRNA]  locus=s79:172882:173392:- [translate_table: standard]